MAQVEAEGLKLANRLGVSIPDFRLTRVANALCLAVRRFDITRLASPYQGRRILISFSTLLGGMHRIEAGYKRWSLIKKGFF